ncbi:aminotransferase class I/II-fold pyridoxal phosphate-dependent enzyme [Secundilactobacillus folii]|uniref:Aminotransferase n=1 Tax=Secundilactobacillus folii TaxID=2678357 RepID=A0A7X2XWZ6_9LACO|nr:aminotransferase class I/II-fold pyridoxal phosphate-dependent enzyme [Secundilactobacillus folii]MTV83156.1 aminotransferase class I/II-fold pyridoxal phosphate-dependent enzyme [Secundilactobacillus folii]
MPELAKDLKPQVNQKLDSVGPSGIRAVNQKFAMIPGIINLTLGEPDFNVPEHVKEAAIKSIQANDSHYSPQKGTLYLRQGIHHYLMASQGLNYDPETEIIATVGATEAIAASLFTILNPGDKVVIPTPAFALYFPLVTIAGCTTVQVNTAPDNFVLTPERLEQVLAKEGDSVKAVLLNYPCNPTGVEYSKEEVEGLAKVIADHHLYVIADEIYSELTYGVDHYSIANVIPERTILINGLSKSHAMTGYRMGYIAGPKDFVANATKMHAFLVTSPSNPAQAAAAEALHNGLKDPVKMREAYQKRRDFMARSMSDMGLEMATPSGAFYAFVKIPASYGQDDQRFANEMAEQAKVGSVPGSAFGAGGEGYIRFSYAASDDDLAEAMKRMKAFVAVKA